MKIYVSSILFYLLLVQIFSLPIVNFFWSQNQPFISQNLCENIDKPLMNCKGKCQLNIQYKKIVAENASDKNQLPTLKIVGIEQFLFIDLKQHFSQPTTVTLKEKRFGFSTNLYHFNFQNTEIKPPNNIIC